MARGQIMSYRAGMCRMAVLGAQVNEQGRVVIPAAIRKQMGIEGPVDVLFRYENGILPVETIEDAVASVQRIVESYVDGDRLLVDELIAQRRVEAATEQWMQSTQVPSPRWSAEKRAVPPLPGLCLAPGCRRHVRRRQRRFGCR